MILFCLRWNTSREDHCSSVSHVRRLRERGRARRRLFKGLEKTQYGAGLSVKRKNKLVYALALLQVSAASVLVWAGVRDVEEDDDTEMTPGVVAVMVGEPYWYGCMTAPGGEEGRG